MLYKVITVSAAVFVGVSLQGCNSSSDCDSTDIDKKIAESDYATLSEDWATKCEKCVADKSGITTPSDSPDCAEINKMYDAMKDCGAAGLLGSVSLAAGEALKVQNNC